MSVIDTNDRYALTIPGSAIIVAAHPDDEVIGIGGHLDCFRQCVIVHTTDGAPRTVPKREQYALLRRKEAEQALALAGIGPDRMHMLGAVDQESIFAAAGLSRLLSCLISENRPQAVFTHAYEGGHPDHDAAALVVAAAVKRIAERDGWAPAVIEFTSYHNGNPHGDCRMVTGEFLPAADTVTETVELSPERAARKSEMLKCFASQQEMVSHFPVDVERFRFAPAYDFTLPPHPGRLFYEEQNWTVTGNEWRALVKEAMRDLGLDSNTFQTKLECVGMNAGTAG